MNKETEKKLIADVAYLKNLRIETNQTILEEIKLLKEIKKTFIRIEQKMDKILELIRLEGQQQTNN